jgi:hypothetical protein
MEDLLRQLVDRLDQRYFGKHRGYVHRVDDPLKLGRIQATIPRLLGDTPTGWAMPCTPYAGPDQGLFVVPDVGSGVWIEFEGGDLSAPIWSGMWWGAPKAEDVGKPDSTAAEHRTDPEVPRHGYPRETAAPGVRMIKTSSGHHLVFDDRPGSARIEIHDAFGNRIILSDEGKIEIVSNDRTVNKGNRGARIQQSDKLEVGRDQSESIAGQHDRTVGGDANLTVKGNRTESVRNGSYKRSIDGKGLTESIGGPRHTDVQGSDERNTSGAVKEVAGGYGITSTGSVNIGSGGAVNIAASTPDLPSLNAVSIDAFIGNISINSKIGMLQLGGMSAISPMVLGDGLAIHLMMLAQILKTVNPLTVAGYGPALDAWAAMTPLLDLSLYGFVKRFPVG